MNRWREAAKEPQDPLAGVHEVGGDHEHHEQHEDRARGALHDLLTELEYTTSVGFHVLDQPVECVVERGRQLEATAGQRALIPDAIVPLALLDDLDAVAQNDRKSPAFTRFDY